MANGKDWRSPEAVAFFKSEWDHGVAGAKRDLAEAIEKIDFGQLKREHEALNDVWLMLHSLEFLRELVIKWCKE